MSDLLIARIFHVIGVVLWIGGVLMVTTVLLPVAKALAQPEDRVEFFERIEGKFAWQARFTTLLVGISGFYMTIKLDIWDRFQNPSDFWWMHAMFMIWLLFTLMLFVFEPLVLRHWFAEKARENPEKVFANIQIMHVILSIASLVTIAGAIKGVHG